MRNTPSSSRSRGSHWKAPREQRLQPGLRVAWYNAAKSPQAHDGFLHRANEMEIEVLAISEPWCGDRSMTKSHPSYDKYSPFPEWDQRRNGPRILVYVKQGLAAEQKLTIRDTRDILWVEVNGYPIIACYREPETDTVIEYLINMEVPRSCLIGGDMNAQHPYFDPRGKNRGRGADLVNWVDKAGLFFSGQPGEITHKRGNVIDHVYTNIPFAETKVARQDLWSGSDHYPLITTIPNKGKGLPSYDFYKITDEDLPRYSDLVGMGMESLRDPGRCTTDKQLEDATRDFTNNLAAAHKAVGKLITRHTKATPWWNEECEKATKALRAKMRVLDRIGEQIPRPMLEETRTFLTACKRAKSDYWRRVINGSITPTQLYKLVAWHHGKTQFKSPPIKKDGRLIENTLEKAEVMKSDLLQRYTKDDDLQENPLEGWSRTEAELPWDVTATVEELQECCIEVTSTSPGVDGIDVRMMRACWEHIKGYLTALYSKCLQRPYFPKTWRYGEATMIPKPGKDPTEVKSWRPITLLSCIGKGYERLIAKRMAWTALTYQVISPQHFGALPKRSCMDLVAAAAHDFENALERRLLVSAATLDAKGAFDALLKKRLLKRLRKQGWPLTLLLLIFSFLSLRYIRVRFEGQRTGYSEQECGTPQGSPISPILYILYLEELMNQDTVLRFGYADDIMLYRISRSLEKNTETLAEDITSILDWGDENKVAFGREKMELLHMARGSTKSNPPVVLPGRFTIDPIPLDTRSAADITTNPSETPALRWLGVWFDRRLVFKRHVSERCTKAMKVAHHIRGLANTVNGPPASMLRLAYTACIMPMALYGTEAWYGGRVKPPTRKRKGHGDVSSGRGWHVKQIDRAFRVALRAVLPAWKTSPIASLHRDAGLPTAEQALQDALYRFAFRLQTIDKDNPIAWRTKPTLGGHGVHKGKEMPLYTRLQTTATLVEKLPRPLLIRPRYTAGCKTDPTRGLTKEEAAKEFLCWASHLPKDDILIYSDGSQTGRTKIGYGFAAYRGGKHLGEGCGRLDPTSINFDAEAVGVWKGLNWLLTGDENLRREFLTKRPKIWLCVDNTGVIWGMRGNAAPSSQWAYNRLHEKARQWDINLKWCPGHCKIEGKEGADTLAKKGAKLDDVDPDCGPTIYGAKSNMRLR